MEEVGKPKVTVFYDGSCNLCAGLAETIDLSKRGSDFALNDVTKGTLPEGVSMGAAMHDMHVVDVNGRTFRGSDAVLRIMEEYPHLRWIATLGRLPGLHLIAMGIYRVVEQTRYWIFGRKTV